MDQSNQAPPVIPVPGKPIIDAGKYIRKKYLKVLMIIIAIAVVLEILIILGGVYQLTFFPIFIVVVFYGIMAQRAEDAFFEQFATVNGFSFQRRATPDDLLGSLFFVGNSRSGYDLVSGKFQDIPFDLFNYRYTVGSGKNSHTYAYTIFRLHFASSLPPVFLKSEHCPFGGFMFGDISKEARERLTLEGDFDKHFDLWTKHDFQIEALQFITPDVMVKLQDNWSEFSLEFVDDQIYIYARHIITKDQELESMYDLAQYLVPKIIPYAKEIKGDIEALNQYGNK